MWREGLRADRRTQNGVFEVLLKSGVEREARVKGHNSLILQLNHYLCHPVCICNRLNLRKGRTADRKHLIRFLDAIMWAPD